MSLYFNHEPCMCRLSSTFTSTGTPEIPHIFDSLPSLLQPAPSRPSTLRRCLRFPPKAKGSGDIRCGKPFPFRWHSVITAVILVTEYVYFPNRLPKRTAKDRSPDHSGFGCNKPPITSNLSPRSAEQRKQSELRPTTCG